MKQAKRYPVIIERLNPQYLQHLDVCTQHGTRGLGAQ